MPILLIESIDTTVRSNIISIVTNNIGCIAYLIELFIVYNTLMDKQMTTDILNLRFCKYYLFQASPHVYIPTSLQLWW